MNGMKSINMGYPQTTFGFDQSHAQDLKKVLALIDLKIAGNDQVMLDQVVNHFSIQPDRWSETQTLNRVLELFNDDKIHFVIDGKKILPENIKTHFSEPARSKLKFLRTREIIAVLKPIFLSLLNGNTLKSYNLKWLKNLFCTKRIIWAKNYSKTSVW